MVYFKIKTKLQDNFGLNGFHNRLSKLVDCTDFDCTPLEPANGQESEMCYCETIYLNELNTGLFGSFIGRGMVHMHLRF